MTIYTETAVESLLNKYEASGKGYTAYTIPGALIDSYIIVGNGLKTAIIKERYLNEYSSGATIRMYNKIPAKYQQIIDLIEESDEDDEQAQQAIYKLFYA